ncbi:MAG TPA: hypothetical protein EYN71_07185, partial [Flavobacteriales bacterium]|nr:hypothetical protein [Flavobacteriales bacterium]
MRRARYYTIFIFCIAFLNFASVSAQDSTAAESAGDWVIFQKTNSDMPDNNALKIVLDKDGSKWIATEKGGLVRLQKETDWTIYETSNSGIPHNSIYAIAIDSKGEKWIG